MHIHLLQDH